MFKDRQEAGQKLAQAISNSRLAIGSKDAIVLALPRGGVIVGAKIAKELNLPLDIVVTRKIGYPGNPEYAVAACGQHSLFLSEHEPNIDKKYLEKEVKKERAEINRRLKAYRGQRPILKLKNKTAILIDDGIATGLTMMAAIEEIKSHKPAQVILAIPVAPPDTIKKIRPMVDELICLAQPSLFWAVGQFYDQFEQTTDQEVINLLSQ